MINKLKLTNEMLADLFYEANTSALNDGYRVGFLSNAAIAIKALIFGKNSPIIRLENSQPSENLAVVFFHNEMLAFKRHNSISSKADLIQISPNRLGFLVRALGLTTTIKLICEFFFIVAKSNREFSFKIFAHPLLGWLLSNYFYDLFQYESYQAILIFNLVHPSSMAAYIACKSLGIKCEYFEHATTPKVSIRPTLVLSKYTVSHPHSALLIESIVARKSKIRILNVHGNARLPSFPQHIRRIGVCFNSLDDLVSIGSVLSSLKHFEADVVIRLHDADRRIKVISRMVQKYGYHFSRASESDIERFLKGVELLIAGNSNVISDSIHANVPAIYYWVGDKILYDYYGLVNAYHIAAARSPNELVTILKSNCAWKSSCTNGLD